MKIGGKTVFSIVSLLLVLKSRSVSQWTWTYLESLNQIVLAAKRPNENSGINHCVYEERITASQTEYNVRIDQLLEGSKWCSERGIIAISAPADGYAKDFFADRLVTLVYDCLNNQRGNIRNFLCLRRKVKEWYIPIIVMKEILGDCCDGTELPSICTNSVKLWLEKHKDIQWNEKQCIDFHRFIEYMFQKGHILLLLPRGCLEYTPNNINIKELIIRELCRGKRERGNIAIYVVDRNKEFCASQYRYSVELGYLSKDEIMNHIRFVVKNNSKTVDFFENLLQQNELLRKELQMPERLLLLSKLLGENSSQDKDISNKLETIENMVQFYEFIIHKSIEMCIRKVCNNDVDSKASQVIYDTLRDIAWRGIDKNRERGLLEHVNENFRKVVNLGDDFQIWSKLTEDEDFLVNTGHNFYFVGCKHYLIAETLFDLFRNDIENVRIALTNSIFLEKSNCQIYLFLLDIIKDKIPEKNIRNKYFDVIWNSITDDKILGENNRAQVLADIMECYGNMEDMIYSMKFAEFILKEISNQYYDSNIFDTLHLISNQYNRLNINNYLKVQYSKLKELKNTEAVDNQKRRLVYYFGKEKCGIPTEVIEDLVDAKIHIHVKYHIILAIIENYDFNVESLLKKHEQEIIDCEDNWKKDYILYSDYLTLLAKRNNVERGSGSEETRLQRNLSQELYNKDYWKRAHAAGALGRQGLLQSVNELQIRLPDEIRNISEEENSLKAVSYMVEAICQIFYLHNRDITKKGEDDNRRQRYKEELENSIKKFMALISSDYQQSYEKVRQDIYIRYFVAFATVSEGIIYLAESVENRMPEEIGKHIKGGRKDLTERYDAITKGLEIISNKFYEEADNAKQKQQMIDKFYIEFFNINSFDNKCAYIVDKHELEDNSTTTGFSVTNNKEIEYQYNTEINIIQVDNVSWTSHEK